MNIRLESIWGLPGPHKFVDMVERNIYDGISLIVIFPSSDLQSEFQSFFSAHANRNSLVAVLDLSTQDQPAVEFLKAALPEMAECAYLEQIVESEFLPHILVLGQFEACDLKYQTEWFAVISRWAKKCHGAGITRSIILPVQALTLGGHKLPEKDTRLAYITWAGILSALEIRMVCRMNASGKSLVEDQWREYVLASLTGGDVRLCEYLWDVAIKGADEIAQALADYSFNHNWSEDYLSKKLTGWKSKPPGSDLRLNPGDLGFDVISQGITAYTPEYGEEESSAVLAHLDRKNEIHHRIWRAQASLLLPIIDEFRRRICDLISSFHHGEDKITVNGTSYDLPAEMGVLKVYFKCLNDYDPMKIKWGSAVRDVWEYRNLLSHYTPVTYDAFMRLWLLNGKLRQS
jgi:hypothetical protein